MIIIWSFTKFSNDVLTYLKPSLLDSDSIVLYFRRLWIRTCSCNVRDVLNAYSFTTDRESRTNKNYFAILFEFITHMCVIRNSARKKNPQFFVFSINENFSSINLRIRRVRYAYCKYVSATPYVAFFFFFAYYFRRYLPSRMQIVQIRCIRLFDIF